MKSILLWKNTDQKAKIKLKSPINLTSNNKMRRKRVSLSKEQREFLNQYFVYNDRPSVDEKYDISFELNMSYKAVQIWFQNTRAHVKKYQRKKALLTYSSDLYESRKEFFADCNALCIQPRKNLIKKYLELFNSLKSNDEKDAMVPKIISTYDPTSCVYTLGYW